MLIEGDQDTARAIAAAAAAKMKQCNLAADKAKALTTVPLHPRRLNPLPGHRHGMPNPLAGMKRGGGDWSVAGIIDWIETIPTDVPADDDASHVDVKAAHVALVLVQATAAARAG